MIISSSFHTDNLVGVGVSYQQLFSVDFFVISSNALFPNLLPVQSSLTNEYCQIDTNRPRRCTISSKLFVTNPLRPKESLIPQLIMETQFFLKHATLRVTNEDGTASGKITFTCQIRNVSDPSQWANQPVQPLYYVLNQPQARVVVKTDMNTFPYPTQQIIVEQSGSGYSLSSLQLIVEPPSSQSPLLTCQMNVNSETGSLQNPITYTPVLNSAYVLDNNPSSQLFPPPPLPIPTIPTVIIENSSVKNVQLTPNFGYFSPPTISFSSPPPSVTATATATIGNGQVIQVVVDNPGLNYSSSFPVTVTFQGGGGGSGAQAIANVNDVTRVIESISVIQGGNDYVTAPIVLLSPPPASQTATAVASINQNFGFVQSIDVVNGGFNYISSIPITVTISGGGGSGATATANVNNVTRTITSFTVNTRGSQYLTVPSVTVSPPPDSIQATASSVLGNGTVSTINVTSGGYNYTTSTPVTITVQGGNGSGAVVQAKVDEFNRSIQQLVLLDGGMNYSPPLSVLISPPSPTIRAIGTPVIRQGRLVSLTLNPENQGYKETPSITISPPSNGIQAVGTIETLSSTKTFTGISIVNSGQGYDPLHPPSLGSFEQPLRIDQVPQQQAQIQVLGLTPTGGLEASQMTLLPVGKGYFQSPMVSVQVIDPNQQFSPFQGIQVVDIRTQSTPSYIRQTSVQNVSLDTMTSQQFLSSPPSFSWIQVQIEVENAPVNMMETLQIQLSNIIRTTTYEGV